MIIDYLLKRHFVPDELIRWKIKRLLNQRLKSEEEENPADFLARIRNSPIAVDIQAANEQHYELPPAFFKTILGKRMKYSCAYFLPDQESLDAAEEFMLDLTCQRAQIQNGHSILELGCGWGSLTLWMAEKFPDSKIVTLSNSKNQRLYIEELANQRGFKNIRVYTSDINSFDLSEKFDRVISVEMFEHMRNVEKLFEKVAQWMKADAKAFVHIFTHSKYSYLFEDQDESDWMARYFFSGGMMPSHNLYHQFSQHLKIHSEWKVSGTHYAKTARAWLRNMDKNRKSILPVLSQVYGADEKDLWWERWRIFFMACEELWAWNDGSEWQVSHYLFQRSEVS